MILTELTTGDSFVHRLHPLTKVALAAVFTISAVALWNPVALALLALFLGTLIAMAQLRLPLKTLFIVLLALSAVAAFNYLGTKDLETASAYFLRFLILLAGFPLCALTTRPEDLARALAAIKLPQGLTVSILMTFRFIPALLQESRAIIEAEALRGDRTAHARGWWRNRLIPFTFSMMDYCDHTATALELRGFDLSQSRTLYRRPTLGWRDGAAGAIAAALIVTAILIPPPETLFP